MIWQMSAPYLVNPNWNSMNTKKIIFNIFKKRHFLSIVIFALLAATVIPAKIFSTFTDSFYDEILLNISDDAKRVANHIYSRHFKEKITHSLNTDMRYIVEDFSVYRIKYFGKDGYILAATNPKDLGQKNTHDYFYEKVAKGEVVYKVVKKGNATLENAVYERDVVEIYIPIMRNGIFNGSFELYYDISTKIDRFEKLKWQLLAIQTLIVLLVLLGVFFLLFYASKSDLQQDLSQQELKNLNMTLVQQVEYEVSERMKVIREKAEQYEMLVQQSKMAAMGEMIGAIAHQWKQPLNAISFPIEDLPEMYENGELNANTIQELCNNVMDQVLFMSQTIDDFRNFFKPSQEKQPFIACETITSVYQMFYKQFEEKNIAMVIHPHGHFHLYGYPNEFKQVVLNILGNAKDVIGERGVRKGVIECTFEKREEMGIIRIKDNGGGIPEELLPDKIFESYFTTKNEHNGTGIGLYISKTIIETHMRGKLWVHNTDNGAEFVIELPLAKQQP